MERDGQLTPSVPQTEFSRAYGDAIGSADPGVVLFGEDQNPQAPDEEAAITAAAPDGPSARPEILGAIDVTALRYARHEGLRRAGLSVTEWRRLYRANIEIESAYDPRARSHVGAIGLGQLMPGTASRLGVDPHDWKQNLDGSARYLATMLDRFGAAKLALAAYNAGPEGGGRSRGHPSLPRNPEPRPPGDGGGRKARRRQRMRPVPKCLLAAVPLLLVMVEPALAQSIDLSTFEQLLQGIIDALTGPLGILIATLALIGVFISWLFGFIDFRQAMWVLVAIAGIAAAPAIVATLFA